MAKLFKIFDTIIYLGSTIAPKDSLGKEINSQIGKASGMFARQTERFRLRKVKHSNKG